MLSLNTSENNISFKNYWYIACQSHELKKDKPLGKVIHDEWIVLFRDEKGAPVAFQDR
jgi:phenylpropionate dioxygenase-like ring-hydroxylating dioxygenase large terminal subunit